MLQGEQDADRAGGEGRDRGGRRQRPHHHLESAPGDLELLLKEALNGAPLN